MTDPPGVSGPSPDGALLVISPHLDDAVLSCGQLLARAPGATVVTVFAGSPGGARELTSWDARAGFRPGDDVVVRRRGEDHAALAVLGARPVWLELLDSQYGGAVEPASIAALLTRVLRALEPATTAFPLGLFHADHRAVSDACAGLIRRGLGGRWLAYEEAIYRLIDREGVTTRLASLPVDGCWQHVVVDDPCASAAKREAVSRYASQLRALAASVEESALATVHDPEIYWRVRPDA